jgi:N-methylhydantoinase A
MVQISRPDLGRRVGGRNGATDETSKTVRTVDFGDGIRRATAVFARPMLDAGCTFEGPAIIEEPSATTVVMPGQQVTVDPFGNLVISSTTGTTREEV